ncbi:hypothetical protein MXB_1437, partial [Myxobolus squamalis]
SETIKDYDILDPVHRRSLRNIPWSSDLWISYMKTQVKKNIFNDKELFKKQHELIKCFNTFILNKQHFKNRYVEIPIVYCLNFWQTLMYVHTSDAQYWSEYLTIYKYISSEITFETWTIRMLQEIYLKSASIDILIHPT